MPQKTLSIFARPTTSKQASSQRRKDHQEKSKAEFSPMSEKQKPIRLANKISLSPFLESAYRERLGKTYLMFVFPQTQCMNATSSCVVLRQGSFVNRWLMLNRTNFVEKQIQASRRYCSQHRILDLLQSFPWPWLGWEIQATIWHSDILLKSLR